MTFFDNIGQKLSQTGQETVHKAKGIAEIARINSLLSGQEKQLENALAQLGRMYYTRHAEDQNEEFSDLINNIRIAEKNIEEYKQQVRDIKGIDCCPQCGAEVAAGSRFCSACGATMPVRETPRAPAGSFCANCGAALSDGASFCTSCGTPVLERNTGTGNIEETSVEQPEEYIEK